MAGEPEMDVEVETFEVDDLLWLISEMPRSYSTPSELLEDCIAREIEISRQQLAATILAGQDAGLVVVWDDPELGPCATLTPLAAERMGLQLTVESDRWLPREKEITEKVAPKPWEEIGEVDPAMYVDPTLPEPLDVLIGREVVEDYGERIGPDTRRLRDGSQVVIRHVLGLSFPWSAVMEPRVERIEGDGFILVRKVCRGCGTAQGETPRLSRNAYCAVCHASGPDGLYPPVEPELRQEPWRNAGHTSAATARPTRKARRKGLRNSAA